MHKAVLGALPQGTPRSEDPPGPGQPWTSQAMGAGGRHPGTHYQRVRGSYKAGSLYFSRSSVLPALPLLGVGGSWGKAGDSLFSDLDEAPLQTSLEQ